ncbi:MAG TPA: nitroreductase family protein [Firmicutes bacterium]|jgi:nitroreductase|nr:nitroreductase family protein [Bacillota bacterium]HOQ24410.1 nitroreductase family protein [Bacillota bacterium]HPT67719.1 nitroreductase family protein [Bacillota bacterium]
MGLALLKERTSVRRYTERPVEREKLEQLIDAARFAPTARNEQPWEFVVVTRKEGLQKLADLTDHGRFIAGAGACIAVFCRETKYYLEDGSAATTYLLLAAEALGLGACWIAGDKKEYAQEVQRLLGVPDGYKLVSLISLGYPAERNPKEKRPVASMLHWEEF